MAGLLFVGVSVFAQPDLNDPKNARVIFHQDFEVKDGTTEDQAYAEWSQTPIDTIHEIEYYSKIGTSSVSSGTDIYDGSADWEIFAVRTDSTSSEWTETNPGDGIIMFNGADPTSSATEIANDVYKNDSWKIVGDPDGLDQDRLEAFKQYGEDPGDYYFQWETGDISAARAAGNISSSHYSTDTRSTKKYRRTLYVRGLDIEEETSYRLTFFIKAEKMNTWNPLFYADVMRGYHHQRAAFSMGYKSGKEFSLEMADGDLEDKVWQKVTMMTYYNNAHEADAYVFYKGDYSWSDDWTWHPSQDLWPAGKTLADGDNLNYVKQPDKFFVRLSFVTDSIKYSLDNLSLTKSWIAGCEYYNDMMRVDFGYQTNLADLAKAAKAKTNIAAAEVKFDDAADWLKDSLGYEYRFEVWGQDKESGDWEEIYIRSAEYHDDGYMYLFTDYYEDPFTGDLVPFQFGDYKQVLVTFHNPIDQPDLTLKYTGSLYPKALDEEWVANGKIVPDFYNEMATPNPYVFDGVKSLSALPPVMQQAPFEEGSFGLDGSIREFKFKFSKEVWLDKEFKGEDTENLVAYVGTEVWIPSWSAEESSLVITRPDGLTDLLVGDQEIKLIQIHVKGGDNGANVVMHYHFGDFDTKPAEAKEYTHSDWRSTLTDTDLNAGGVAVGTWSHSYDSSKEQFERGLGQEATSTKCRLYILSNSGLDNCGYYVSPRCAKGNSKPKYSGNLFALVSIDKAGSYSIKFKAAEWWNKSSTASADVETHLYFYPKPAGDEADFTFETFSGVSNKTDLGSINPNTHVLKDDIKDVSTGSWPSGVETFEYTFSVTTPGEYIFEWCVFFPESISSSSNGLFIGNYTIGTVATTNLSTKYVKNLINALSAAQTKLDAVTDDNYKGADYTALGKAVEDGDKFVGNYPSQYDSVVAYINDCVKTMNLRIETVDLYYTTEKSAKAKLAAIKGDSVNLATYKALDEHLKANDGLVCSTKELAELTAEIEAYEAEMKAIDDRLALMDKFNVKLAETKALIDAAARDDYDEYDAMKNGYETALNFDLVREPDENFADAYNALVQAKNGYLFKYDYYIAKTRQIKELYALAVSLGYEFGGDMEATVKAIQDEDADLSTLLREAAIYQILGIYNDGNEDEINKIFGLDVSALIPNYYLYNEAQEERDMEKNSSGNWRLIKQESTTAIPGWKFTSTSGSWYFTTAKVDDPYVAGSYTDWAVDGHVFIGGLRSASSTKGVLTTTVTGLPEGYYNVGLYAYNQTSDLAFEFKTDSVTLSGKVNTVMNNGQKFNFKEVGIDSVMVVGDLIYTIDQKSSSSSEFDMRSAVLHLQGPNPECDYEAALEAQEAKMELLTIVDARQANKAGVEYYTIGGIKLDAPKAGQILIRKTTQNGKVVVDKVLIK